MPTAADYRDAFLAVRPKIRDAKMQMLLRMLTAHYQAPGRSMSMGEIAAAGGYRSYRDANIRYGGLAKVLAAHLKGFEPQRRSNSTEVWLTAIAEPDPSFVGHSDWRWIMRPEVAEALEELGWVSRPAEG